MTPREQPIERAEPGPEMDADKRRATSEPRGRGATPDELLGEMIEELDLEVGADATEAAEGADESPAEVLSEVDLLRRERDEYLDSLRRLQAEFENYRKRMMRQQSEQLGRAAESLIERILPVLDALDLALAHGTNPDVPAAEVAAALGQIAALGRDILAREGLERIDEAGVPFDPTIHDAVAHVPVEDGEAREGVVVDDVLRAGYQLKGRVVRPAMVRVRG